MQDIVIWWCNLIGITNDTAIQVAVGVVGGVSFVIVATVILALALIFILILNEL